LVYGAPGTGKTTTIEALSKALGAPLIKLDFESLEADDLSGVRRTWSAPCLPGETKGLRVKGAIRDSVRDSGVRNPIVLIDEFSGRDLLRNTWKEIAYKKLFNQNHHLANEQGLEDLSHVIFILLTNDSRQDLSPAIRSRFIEFDWPDLDDETLAKVLSSCLSETISELQNSLEQKLQEGENTKEKHEAAVRALSEAQMTTKKYSSFILSCNSDLGARTIRQR
jgi:MoxR-like ATPase